MATTKGNSAGAELLAAIEETSATLLLATTADDASLIATELVGALMSELELSWIGVDSDMQPGSKTAIAAIMGAGVNRLKGRALACITLFPVRRCLYIGSANALLLV